MRKDQLLRKIKKEFPDIIFKKSELITDGWMNDVIVLDNKLIFRFVKKRSDKKTFLREVKFLKDFCKISNVTVPEYIFLSKDGSFGGYKMIKGNGLTPLIYQKLSKKQQKKITRTLADFINILHGIPLKKLKKYGFKSYQSWKEEMKDQKIWFRNNFEKKVSKKLTLKENLYIEKFTTSYYGSDYFFKPVLGHNDLSHDHILINNNGDITGVIDFGDLAIADPADELSGFFNYSATMPAQMYKLYTLPKDRDLLKRAEQRFMYRWVYLIYAGLVRRQDKTLYKDAKKQLGSFIQKNII